MMEQIAGAAAITLYPTAPFGVAPELVPGPPLIAVTELNVLEIDWLLDELQ